MSDELINKLLDLHDNINIANDLDEIKLKEIGSKVCQEFEMDMRSRADWEKVMDKAMAIAKQTFDRKTFPWEGAANVKYPLIPTAVINSASRIYQEIIKGEKVVHATVIGKDEDGTATDRAERISRHMSHQLLVESDEWEEGTDRLLVMVAFLGTVFRKTYYDPLNLSICSDVCSPKDIVIHDSVKSLETARRISHVIYKYRNDIISYINAGIYKDIDLEALKEDSNSEEDAALEFIEMHRFLDLDEDGYAEPYIVTVHKKSEIVVRINSRWDMDGVKLGTKGKVIKIEPTHYFSDYHWLHSPDGSYYSMGFGALLYPHNDTINTLINQLLDSGTLSNLQGGFIGRGVRIKNGSIKPKMGEWSVLESAAGADLRSNIVPFPTKDPSPVLLQLLSLLIESGKQLSAVTDALSGQEQAQNVPATTILSLIKQGLVVFSSIQKRIYRGFKKEFAKIYRLNKLYLDQTPQYFGEGKKVAYVTQEDYEASNIDIKPVADPNMSSDMLKATKIQGMMQVLQMLSPEGQKTALTEFLQELQIPESVIEKLLSPAPPPPTPPDVLKMQVDAQKDHVDMQLKARELDLKEMQIKIDALEKAALAEKFKADAVLDIAKAKQADLQFKLDAYLSALDRLDPEKGVTMTHIKPILDSMIPQEQPEAGEQQNDNEGAGVSMEGQPSNQAPIQVPGAGETGSTGQIG